MKHAPKAKVSRIVQQKTQFVIHSPKVYHEGFKMGYNVARSTNFADYLSPEIGRIVAKNRKQGRPTSQCTFPVEETVWMKALHSHSKHNSEESLSSQKHVVYQTRPFSNCYQILWKWLRKTFHVLNSVIAERFKSGMIVSQRLQRTCTKTAKGNNFCSFRFSHVQERNYKDLRQPFQTLKWCG